MAGLLWIGIDGGFESEPVAGFESESVAVFTGIRTQIGVERRSAQYVNHLYGVSAAESNASGMPTYLPGAAITPILAIAAEIPVAEHLNLDFQWQHEWLGSTIERSPLVDRKTQDTGFIALSYQFKPL
jgi:outer membrane protein